MYRTALLTLLIATVPAVFSAQARVVWLDDLDLSAMRQDFKRPVAKKSIEGLPLRLAGTEYKRGIGSHASGAIYVALDGQAERFQAVVGVDDETRGRGSVVVKIYSGTERLFASEVLRGGGEPARIDLDLRGVKQLLLCMYDGGDGIHYDHVDWADAKFLVSGADPKVVAVPAEDRVILTPKPPKEPRINGPRITGVRPGSPFLFRIPTTGERPMRFSAENLPEGLVLDLDAGILSGTISSREPRTYTVTLSAENTAGRAERELRIVVGDTLALTPPMGYNHWYAHYDRITDAMMREAADVMVRTGMADAGYQYVNIDDCWMNAEKSSDPMRVGPLRDANGQLMPNAHFPDMKGLADYIHAKGLRAGLYTSPGPFTCAGFAGAFEHEEQDARLFASWGFDFLKYDWCSYDKIAKDHSLEELQKPYRKMSAILKTLDRDIVLNLCQYGMGDVWTWGREAGGHCWRTAGDLGFELTRYHDVARRNAAFAQWAGPGAWNDPDYLQIGFVGEASKMGKPIPCPLTPNEQYSYMSLWCLMASPLFFSGDMPSLDEFTLNILCNPEVIEIDQDPLGAQGGPVFQQGETEIWRKPLEDGSFALGLFNLSEIAQSVTARWSDLGLEGLYQLRDLWRQQDLGGFETEFRAEVPRHGVLLLRCRRNGKP